MCVGTLWYNALLIRLLNASLDFFIVGHIGVIDNTMPVLDLLMNRFHFPELAAYHLFLVMAAFVICAWWEFVHCRLECIRT